MLDVWSFQTDLFQKAPYQKSSNKAQGTQWCLCFNKMLFYKQTPHKSWSSLALAWWGNVQSIKHKWCPQYAKQLLMPYHRLTFSILQ